MAARYKLFGEVDNRTDGVSIIVQGDIKKIDRFSNDILENAPPASQIKSIEVNPVESEVYNSFKIARSRITGNQITEISPDIAVCQDCLNDMQNDPSRIDYPFINCTNCGPRFTIIEGLPYDRSATTMKVFRMCKKCKSEYHDILDRRFHAQPIACNSCGPRYIYKSSGKRLDDIPEILKEVSLQTAMGKIIAVKGTGGYHLMCDALNEEAVKGLRRKKRRDSKPFAVMFRDVSEVKKYCYINEAEEKELKSWQRPILILKQRKTLAAGINNDLTTIGAMLPYMPFHYLLFRELKTPVIVLTSANISDEPVITDDRLAELQLAGIADAFLSYNRQILNRADDSVVRIIDDKLSLIRRSRGYVPRPVDIKSNAEGVLALGASQKNSFCIGKGRQAIMSQYIGDIINPATFDFFNESIGRLSALFGFRPGYIACDLHPDYLSTQLAEELAEKLNLPLIKVQHHHAHVGSCMAEYGLDEEVIGISFDGTGFGSDGNIWGGEFMIADLKGFQRYSHFDYVPLPGGEKAIEEPWRIAFSYIDKYFGDFDFDSIPAFKTVEKQKLDTLRTISEKKINSPLSSGAGRLFDAVSAILGLCTVATFDSEAPIRLESAIQYETDEYYPFSIGSSVVFADTIRNIIADLPKKGISFIAAKFHNTVSQVILEVSLKIREETSINKVILSGGVFQNKYLLEKSLYLLNRNRFKVFTNHLVPANDGGISLGQLVIASKIRESCV